MPESASAPPDFASNFPGTPYAVQNELMCAMHAAMTNRHIALLESPTGTGKTMSIIVSSLTWLLSNRDKPLPPPSTHPSIEPDWIAAHAMHKHHSAATAALDARRTAHRLRVANIARGGIQPVKGRRLRRCVASSTHPHANADDVFSDDDDQYPVSFPPSRDHMPVRVVFATRTHSQLAQFVSEFRRTPFARAQTDQLPVAVVLFGSRKQLCVNDSVRNLPAAAAVTERCRELTERVESASVKRKRSANCCAYKSSASADVLRDKALVATHSIEELAEEGKRLAACPYFATRAALDTGHVDVIGVPYSAVLHAPTRDSLGLTVDENTVVIFDEAHNIVQTVCDLHSAVLTRPALQGCLRALRAYLERYEARFSPHNLFCLRQLLTLGDALVALLPARGTKDAAPRVVRPSALIFEAGVDNINLYSLVAFLKESQLSRKLRGFLDTDNGKGGKQRGDKDDEQVVCGHRSAKQGITAFETFLASVSDCASHGRVAIYPYRSYVSKSTPDHLVPMDSTARLKYFVTGAGELFRGAVGNARSVLMLGGTLTPRAAIKDALFTGIEDRVTEFECGHVVAAENVFARVVSTGPSGQQLEFTHRTKQGFEVTDELGKVMEHVVDKVPGGIVVFFSSYDYLESTRARWASTGTLGRLEGSKRILVENRGCDGAFEDFRGAVMKDGGGMLLAVMGGRLSEGINFSDELGRLVVIVGMPFANATDVETAEILRGKKSARERGECLENSCMTVVNQCVGRAVRHRNDYAAILLVDRRYGRDRVAGKIAGFVRRSLAGGDFQGIERELAQFFVNR